MGAKIVREGGLEDFGRDRRIGLKIIARACEELLRQIVLNLGLEGAVVVENVRESTPHFGYNAASGKYEDLIAAGVIDATKVTRTAPAECGLHRFVDADDRSDDQRDSRAQIGAHGRRSGGHGLLTKRATRGVGRYKRYERPHPIR